VGSTIAAGDPIPTVTSVSVASSIPAATLIAAGVSTTAEEQDATLRKSSRKKSIARRRTLPSAYKPKSDALFFDEDDPEAEFKRYLRQASDDDEPAKPVSFALDQWQIWSWRFYALPAIHVLETEAEDIMPSSPPPIPFGPAPTSGVVSTEPIPDIPFSSGPSEPVLETIIFPFGDDNTGGGSFHESPPRPYPATPTISPTVGVAEEPLTLTSLLALFPTCLQRIATLEAELKATKILHRDI
nr:hypothetical protein [Tanacetum cinerariifolium]